MELRSGALSEKSRAVQKIIDDFENERSVVRQAPTEFTVPSFVPLRPSEVRKAVATLSEGYNPVALGPVHPMNPIQFTGAASTFDAPDPFDDWLEGHKKGGKKAKSKRSKTSKRSKKSKKTKKTKRSKRASKARK